MSTLVIAGLSWGDEGKGKLVDLFAEKAHHVVRAQGGHNAGHTVHKEGKEFHFHLLPSGILSKQTTCYLGAGVALYPPQLIKEIQSLPFSLKPEQLLISPYTQLIMPYHIQLDQAIEKAAQKGSIGTTLRGIGPCYADRVNRLGIKVADLLDPKAFQCALRRALEAKKHEFAHYKIDVNPQVIENQYIEHREFLKDRVDHIEERLNRVKGEYILLEGAQGALLDVTFGSYPFVTSSQTITGGMLSGSGLSPQSVVEVLGVLKAYQTRVGAGPFPTELSPDERALFPSPQEAREVGVSTGRDRRLGWFDIPMAKHAIDTSNATSFVMMKLDILDQLQQIKVCTHYTLNSKTFYRPPPSTYTLQEVTPHYKVFPGWKKSTRGIAQFEDLPIEAQNYCKFIEETLEIPLKLISTSPKQTEWIPLCDPIFEQWGDYGT